MSSSLMSCVRENSPPLELDINSSGPLSLPESSSNTTMSGVTSIPLATAHSNDGVPAAVAAAPMAEQQKRRRFHPLRNLRRIFRRRTITSVADTPSSTLIPATSSTSEKNLRSATLTSISSAVSASSPSSPLTHQQLQDAYSSQSLPKSKTYSVNVAGKSSRDVLLSGATGGYKGQQQQQQQQYQRQQQQQSQLEHKDTTYDGEMYTTAPTATSAYQQHHMHTQYYRQPLGVAVLPSAMSRSFYTERQKLRSIGDSSQELDSSGNDSGSNIGGISATAAAGGRANGSGGEMTDSQRSLSEGRLVDSDYTRDQLSQSHDSVFSESATASSLSIVLKAELADVLRKRRNRPDASDEDLGLPRSPASPQRRNEHHSNTSASIGGSHNHSSSNYNNNNTTTTTPTMAGNHSEVSSLSLLSMISTDGEDLLAASTANNSSCGADVAVEQRTMTASRYTRSSTYSGLSSSSTSDLLRHSMSSSFQHEASDEVDLFSTDCQRLSHAAAKHKMAVRPTKKKGPSRQHRRTLETAIPEANEDNLRMSSSHFLDVVDHDAKAKTRSLPPGVNAKSLEQHADSKKTTATTITAAATAAALSAELTPQLKRTKTDTREPTVTASVSSLKPLSTNNNLSSDVAAATSPSAPSSNTNIFGLRALSAKATALFEPKEATPTELNTKKQEYTTTTSSVTTSSVTSSSTVETTESGFLRRLIQRNSKRSIARASGDDELDGLQSEPKKLQISTSSYDTRHTSYEVPLVDKCKSSTTCEQSIEEKRREIKREIKNEGKSGLSAMLNNFMLAEKSAAAPAKEQPAKPKSGPAARQRYVPQDIGGTLEKKPSVAAAATNSNVGTRTTLKEATSSHSVLSSSAQLETFQSTSIIREITASQSSTLQTPKAEQHYEKKPKIVGLSAFQQKISRSNDSFGRAASTLSSSNNSLESNNEAVFLNYEQKQRRLVEKSRSFRNYQDEQEEPPAGVHNNMPSLPDLSLNLRVPCFSGFVLSDKEYSSPSPPESHDKSVSLGFEINDNNLLRTTPRAESAYQLSTSASSQSGGYNKNTALNAKHTPTKQLYTPSNMVPNLSPSSSCTQNISEIEQNIDLIVKSPYVNVLRKSGGISDDMASKLHNTELSATSKSQETLEQHATEREVVRPKVLQLVKEQTNNSADKSTLTPSSSAKKPLELQSPQRVAVRPNVLHLVTEKTPSSELKSAVTPSTLAGVRKSLEPQSPQRELIQPKLLQLHKEQNTNSEQNLPATPTFSTTTPNSLSISSMISTPSPTTAAVPLREKTRAASATRASVEVPEAERKSAPTASVSSSKANSFHATRRSSSATTEQEKQTDSVGSAVPEFLKIQLNRVAATRSAKSNVVLAKNVKEPTTTIMATKTTARAASNDDLLLRRSSNDSVDISEQPSPELEQRSSGVFEAINKQAAKSVSAYSLRGSSSELPAKSSVSKSTTPVGTPTECEEGVVLRAISNESVAASNKLSLQERKRLFMNEERNKTDKRIEELRNERKKSINEEVFRKSFAKSEEQLNDSGVAATTPTGVATGMATVTPTVTATVTPTITPVGTPVATPTQAQTFAQSLMQTQTQTQSFTQSQTQTQSYTQSQTQTQSFTQLQTQSFTQSQPQTQSFTQSSLAQTQSVTQPPSQIESTEGTVVLRKKSFGGSTLTNSVSINTSNITNNTSNITNNTSNITNNNNNGNSSRKDDATPELMKVFARRSLKIKEEDLNMLADKLAPKQQSHSNSSNNSHTSSSNVVIGGSSSSNTLLHTTSLKRFSTVATATVQQQQQQQSVDSDKENQSASEEKLDKLPKYEVAVEPLSAASVSKTSGGSAHTSNNSVASSNNRNSMADFRMSSTTKISSSQSNGLSVSNNNNNNNNHNNVGSSVANANVSSVTSLNGSSKVSFLPPIKVGGFRSTNAERVSNGGVAAKLHTSSSHTEALHSSNNNNNNNNNNNSNAINALNNNGHSKSTLERQSLNIKPLDVVDVGVSEKAIERSATVGEFKGIHQRRAEWEQRAKEALK